MDSNAQEGLLTVDLKALEDNYQNLCARLADGSNCGAVVKADAYGLGMARVAPKLYRCGCRDFFVATQAEGETLISLLPTDVRIVVLTGVRDGCEKACAQAGLIPALFTFQQVNNWVKYTQVEGKAAPCALKVDSGLTRLGMTGADFNKLLRDDRLLSAANIQLLFSHLACADEPQRQHNGLQLQHFQQFAAQLRAQSPGVRLSLANSSGIYLGDRYHFDLARPGAALYGVNPKPGQLNPMRAVVNLRVPVIQQRRLHESAYVGYGATQQVAAGSWLAVARAGYADGILRAQSGRGWGVAGDVKVPMVGRLSMDTCVFDVSGLSLSQRESLVHIELLNRQLKLDEVASYGGTNGYEVLTSLGHRYARCYLDD